MYLKNIKVKTLELKSYDKVYVTLDFKQSWTLTEIQGIIDEALDYITGKGLFIISEKTVGSVEYMDFYLELREQMFKAHGLDSPSNTYIEGLSISHTCLTSITFYTIAIKNDTVKASYLYDDSNAVVGTCLTTRLVSYLYLSNIRCLQLRDGDFDEFKVWEQTNNYILNHGFALNNIVRSCINISDVHRTRSKEDSLAADPSLSDYTICTDIVCMKSNTSKPNLNHNSQIHYKLTSSYGQLFEDEDCLELMIDGKSNIKNAVSDDEAYIHIYNTLNSVKLLLDQAGLSYDDILEATCFFKHKNYYTLYNKAVTELGIGDFCSSYAVGDSSREDLLFELNAMAYKALKVNG